MNKTVAYITDTHIDEQFPMEQGVDARRNWEIILKDLKAKNINDVIFGGDIGEKSINEWFFETLKGYNLRLTLGNHDYYEEASKYYQFSVAHRQKELYSSQEYQGYKLIFLDSSQGTISESQLDWFKNELVTDKAILLFLHHPILEVNCEVDRKYSLTNRDELKKELFKVDKEINVFCGHYHFDDYRSERNINQYITPACSYQVEKIPKEVNISSDKFGYRLINIEENSIDTELVMFEVN